MLAATTINSWVRRVPRPAVYVLGLIPAVWTAYLLFTGGLGVDPVEKAEHRLGLVALQFLIAVLAVTPLMHLTGIKLLVHRRALGVLAFVYAVLHLTIWLVLDMQFYWAQIAEDLVKRPYIIIGMVGFLAMLPLAWTSRDAAIRKMGPVNWRRLHRLAYVAGIAGALHYLMLVKTLTFEPLFYAGLLLALLIVRLLPRRVPGKPKPA
jgi:sulfoxide reductase heme-binding subunit YedZ